MFTFSIQIYYLNLFLHNVYSHKLTEARNQPFENYVIDYLKQNH